MKLEKHVLNAIDDFIVGDTDSALMNACISIDGTARKLFKINKTGKRDYKNCIRQYYWLVERFTVDGLNLEETVWTNITLDNGNGKNIENPDLADIIYHIFRCSDAHCHEVPIEYELLPSSDGHSIWEIGSESVKMPDKIIWALLAISVFSKANADIKTESNHFLTWGSETLKIGTYSFPIKESWGREQDVRSILDQHKQIRVKLDGLDELNKSN